MFVPLYKCTCDATCSRRCRHNGASSFLKTSSPLPAILSMQFKPLPHQRFPVMLTQGCVNARFHYSLLQWKHVFGHIPELWLWKHVNVKPSAAFQKALPADESGSNTSFCSGLSAGISKWSSRHSATRLQPVPVSNWELCVMLDVIRERQRTVILHRDSRQSPTIGSLISSAQAPAFKRDLHLLSLSC